MMDKNNLDKLVELTQQLTPIPEMAVLLDMTEGQLRMLLDDPSRDEYLIYRKTLAQVANNIRKRDIELAEAGSPTAAAAVSEYLNKVLEDL